MIRIVLGDDAEFDKALGRGSPGVLRDGGDLAIISKDKGTEQGRPVVVLTFTVELPDGSWKAAQTTVTYRELFCAVKALEGRYGPA